MSVSEEIMIGGIRLRFVDGQLQRRLSESSVWLPALYTSVDPGEADKYAAFCRSARAASLAAAPGCWVHDTFTKGCWLCGDPDAPTHEDGGNNGV